MAVVLIGPHHQNKQQEPCKGNFSTTTATTFFKFIFPSNSLAKLAYFFKMAVGGRIVLERLRARQSLYPQIVVHAVFLMLFSVLN
jgi:hypothetical protein